MMRKLLHMLKSPLRGSRGKRGESLTEVLVAVAVGGLALLMLAMAISVSSHVATGNRNAMGAYYEVNNAIATGAAGTSLGTGTVSLSEPGGSSGLALVRNGESLQAQYRSYPEGSSSAIIVYESKEGGA